MAKAFICDGCKKSPARFGLRVRGRPYFEGEEAVSASIGDFCGECLKSKFPDLVKAKKK